MITYLAAGQASTSAGSISDKGKEWHMELLMEKLRSKASTLKPLVETAKNVRMAMLVSNFYLFYHDIHQSCTIYRII